MEAVKAETPTLARYVPRQSAEWDLRTTELWREIDGTLCYVDISGFTALSEKLARRGRIGAEELTGGLNHVFGEMLGVAYDRGGSLLKFGGDALLLVFTGRDHPIQACSAAVEMQAALRNARNYETSAGRLRLKMSVGLHSGTVHLFRVGESHKELILTGPAASMTTEMEETATAGEVLISSATRAAIPSGAAVEARGEGWRLRWRKARIECCGWSPRIALQPEAIEAGLPTALRDYLRYGTAEPEHRIATVGFIKYSGVDAVMAADGPVAVASALDELVRNVQEATDLEGVTFLASDIDKNGGKIILVAGVPAAQEDDEGRVLRAVRRIADRAGTLSLRIGVNQGHVFAGEIGTDLRATYTIMGDTVNLAARLMAAASPGEIYASPSALDRSRTLFETTALEPFHVKGKQQPVQAYAVGAETGSRPADRTDEVPFVGRTEELAQLTAAIDRLNAGKGGVIAVIGETGIGKSRLVDEVLPHLDGARHVTIRSEPYGVATPYRPWRDPIRELLRVERASHDDMAVQLGEAVKALDPTLVPLTPLIADVAMVETPSTPEVDAIEPRFRQDRTADAVVDVLERVFSGPVLFEVEDAHWMDDASAHVLERIVQRTHDRPWLVLATRREDDGGFHPKSDEIRLGPLPDEAARRLIIEATEAAPLRPHELESIVTRAGGLPLFLEEIIGAVRGSGGTESLPDTLDAVVAAQIDALTPLPRRLLRYASILGRSFRIETLNQLISSEGVELDAATREQLLGFLDREGEDRLRFRHALLRDVAYEGLSYRKRRQLHRRAGEIAEQAAGDDVESVADVLALHFSLAGDHERTWRYARIAGDQAREAYANVEAAEHYARALEAARHLPDVDQGEKLAVWTYLGEVRDNAGLFEDSYQAYRRASQLAKDDAPAQAVTYLRRARVREHSGAFSQALREIGTGTRLVAGNPDPVATALRAQLTAAAATVRQAQERPGAALSLAEQAIAEATPVNATRALGRAYQVANWAHLMLGEPERAVYSPAALRVYEDLGDLGGQAHVMGNMGVAAYFAGRWDEAVELYLRAQDALERSGNAVQAAIGGINVGEVLANQNRLDEAESVLRDAVRTLRASGVLDAAAFGEIHLGRVLSARGDFATAERLLIGAREEFLALGAGTTAMDAQVCLAECHLRRGEPDAALDALGEAEEWGGEEFFWHVASQNRVRAAALLELGRMEEATEALSVGLDAARQHGLTYEEVLLLEVGLELERRVGREPDPASVSKLSADLGIRRLSVSPAS